MFYDIYLYTLCYYICCLLGACMRCTRLCPLKPGVTVLVLNASERSGTRTRWVQGEGGWDDRGVLLRLSPTDYVYNVVKHYFAL
jgi:hypothetical protein